MVKFAAGQQSCILAYNVLRFEECCYRNAFRDFSLFGSKAYSVPLVKEKLFQIFQIFLCQNGTMLKLLY